MYLRWKCILALDLSGRFLPYVLFDIELAAGVQFERKKAEILRRIAAGPPKAGGYIIPTAWLNRMLPSFAFLFTLSS